MAADASAFGVGAVISHIGEEKPVAFASRTLTSSDRNYAQIEKEAFALVFGIRKFHQYLYGRKFTSYHNLGSKDSHCCCSTSEVGSATLSIPI
jgi:hypothetical protein